MDAVSGCQEICGDIVVEDFPDALLSLNLLQKVSGSIRVVRSPALIRFEATEIETVTETIQMDRLQSLAMITMPRLVHVKELDLRVLPLLTHMVIGNLEDVQSLRIADTSLVSFSEARTANMTNFDINNNRYMEAIVAEVEEVSNTFHIAGNGRNVRVEANKLRSANNITVNNVESLNLDNLEEVHGSFSILENSLTALSLPKLSRVEGSMRIADNRILNDVHVGSLRDIGGGLLIINNTQLNDVSFFQNLTVIGGGLDVEGNVFRTRWPSLRFIKGAATMISTDSTFDCSQWLSNEVGNAMRGGEIKCIAAGKLSLTRGSDISNRTSAARDEASAANRSSITWTIPLLSLFVFMIFT